jgi:hypothetical protein
MGGRGCRKADETGRSNRSRKNFVHRTDPSLERRPATRLAHFVSCARRTWKQQRRIYKNCDFAATLEFWPDSTILYR